MRCPTFRNLASDLMSIWIRSPGLSHSYRCTGGLGSRSHKCPSPKRLRALATVEKGVLQQPGDVTQMQPLVPEIHGVLHHLIDTAPASGRRNGG